MRKISHVLHNCGVIDYASIEEYIARDGYFAIEKCLKKMTPSEVIEEVSKSGLRGRGGGGFPVGLKWSMANKVVSDQKYLICNADEGDPGAFMDRSLLEGDANIVIEGMWAPTVSKPSDCQVRMGKLWVETRLIASLQNSFRGLTQPVNHLDT